MLTRAKTDNGVLRGRAEGGLTVFRGVRYATCERFAPPRPVPAWSRERDATVDGSIAPQGPSRLEPVMGVPERHEQDEDCLNLTITTPQADDRARPVLVWFHGGAWVSGAGSWKCYGGHRLAREGDVVVVSVGHRLGVLGYLRSPGISEGNLGLADQLAALRWVRDNIAAFGGDPNAVTVAGQSAGAHTVQCLLGMPDAEGLFRRAIIQSVPAGLGLGSARTAQRAARRFHARLGTDPRTAPLAHVLTAQSEVAREAAGRSQLNTTPRFAPVAGVGPLPDEARWATCLAERAPGLSVVIGTTGQEMSAFYATNPALRRLRRIPVLGAAAADTVERVASAAVFSRPTRHLAGRLSGAGARVWAYRFDYAAPGSPFGAAHCIELPFLFGTDADWATAPMLAGARPDDIETLGRRLRTAWLGFVRTGTPNTGTPWPRFTADAPAIHYWYR
ncbi:carboxylesterase/lipase family protein [Nocardiopsis sp. NRRL B-16309]|uniref:carboxylesterase/lipase family protein n=1 Tax=Nocardiopsis sp. NRRL B-16309 TaxID=1519494 RepID=UPI0006AE8DAE|nr:carboxylesterase family protein [Nocardiopsis sp. NRRL B-16309]KOX12664.1 carboxylesterase [Nocardiopsis sp. NRRL B-16309]